jgi:metallo-beta-lactamase class B
MKKLSLALVAALLAASASASAADWNAPQEPFAVYGNTYYVGTHGISSVLITSKEGHILIDSATAEAPAQIMRHIRQLGFKIEDIKIIVNSHEHHDHAGGLAELQHASGAAVLVSPASAAVLRTGLQSKSDPQFSAETPRMAPVAGVKEIRDGTVVSVGPLRVTAHFTPGHTQGGTSWTWQATEGGVTANMVYADSLNAYANKPFQYRNNKARTDLERSIASVAALPCDILISAHPEVSDLWDRKAKAEQNGNAGFIDKNACRTYAAKGTARLAEELIEEGTQP